MKSIATSIIMPSSAKSISKKTYFVTLAIISSLILVSIVVYLFQIEALTQKNFVAKKYATKIKELEEQNLSLEATKTELVSLEEVESKIYDSGFVGISEASYIPISFDYLARNTSN